MAGGPEKDWLKDSMAASDEVALKTRFIRNAEGGAVPLFTANRKEANQRAAQLSARHKELGKSGRFDLAWVYFDAETRPCQYRIVFHIN